MIKILDQKTINKIAAGEVVERPSSVVKELVENAIDSGATAITVEIKDGGISFIRITDNGSGIPKEEVPTAFVRHATSKIMTIEDLLSVSSLGFRGEALASIAAVAQVECITKTAHDLTGLRYEIHGGTEVAKEEIGAPTGTTVIIRNLFFNVPARKKFLKTAMTEGGYITELITRLALSKPEISFKYIINGSNKIATSGNGKLKDVIYHLYGKDVSSNLLPLKRSVNDLAIEGYVGKAFVSKGNRSFEHYFVNGRAIRSNVVTKAIEEAYKSFVMIHKFPFTCIHLTLDSHKLDVNVHPTKMEFKYADSEVLFQFVKDSVRQALLQEEMIPDVSLRTNQEQKQIIIEQQRRQTMNVPEPFETSAREKRYRDAFTQQAQRNAASTPQTEKAVTEASEKQMTTPVIPMQERLEKIAEGKTESGSKEISDRRQELLSDGKPELKPEGTFEERVELKPEGTFEERAELKPEENPDVEMTLRPEEVSDGKPQLMPDAAKNLRGSDTPLHPQQLALDESLFLSEQARKKHRLIGQVFKTYWMIEYDNKLYIIDQHAAHEKVMFERLMHQMAEKKVLSQQLLPPKVLHLSGVEHTLVMEKLDWFEQTGFEIEDFGDDAIVIRSMPDDIMGVDPELLFDSFLNALVEDVGKLSIDFFVEKLSGMACKRAIKGNTEISFKEADALIDELLTLENPYNCPHGRPTMISLTKSEMERKFKRIQD